MPLSFYEPKKHKNKGNEGIDFGKSVWITSSFTFIAWSLIYSIILCGTTFVQYRCSKIWLFLLNSIIQTSEHPKYTAVKSVTVKRWTYIKRMYRKIWLLIKISQENSFVNTWKIWRIYERLQVPINLWFTQKLAKKRDCIRKKSPFGANVNWASQKEKTKKPKSSTGRLFFSN